MGTVTLRAEHQSARMSQITNDGLTRSDTLSNALNQAVKSVQFVTGPLHHAVCLFTSQMSLLYLLCLYTEELSSPVCSLFAVRRLDGHPS